MCMYSCSVMSDSVASWSVAHQVPLSMKFSRQNTGGSCHFLLQSIVLTQESNHVFSAFPAFVSRLLNIQKTKIMASGPITSWEMDGKTVETVSDFIFWAPKSLQMVTAAMKLKGAYSLEEKL